MSVIKKMNHADYQERVKKLSYEELKYTVADARAAIEAYPENPNAGYYMDEIHYCLAEIRRRTNEGGE